MSNTTKERPILFSAPMVRAILDGRKTQTRRVVKPHHLRGSMLVHDVLHLMGPQLIKSAATYCPHGQPGDRLWVRETWMDRMTNPDFAEVEYRADYDSSNMPDWKWKPSIFMPRAYSRITLEIVAVRVERLNDISEADAAAEGLSTDILDPYPRGDFLAPGNFIKNYGLHADAYRDLWESINGPGSWEQNPWVWVVEFRRVK